MSISAEAVVQAMVTNSTLTFIASHAAGAVTWHALAARYGVLFGVISGASIATFGVILFVKALGGETAVKPAGLAYLMEFVGVAFALILSGELLAAETGDAATALWGMSR